MLKKPLLVRCSGLLVVLATMTGMLLVASSSEAQPSVEARGGATFPVGDLVDTADPGFGLGVTLAHSMGGRLSLTLDGSVSVLEEREFDESARPFAVSLWHYTTGVRYRITDPGATRWSVAVSAGLGASTLDSDDFGVAGIDPPLRNPETGEFVRDLGGTYFTTRAGVRVGHPITGSLSLFADVRATAAFADEEETATLVVATAGEADPLGVAITVPVTLGGRIAF